MQLLPNPAQQWSDADGKPYAGGTLSTFVPGTTTGKPTWAEPSGTVLNSNPIILDSAGRAIVYGDGEYRLILNDSTGNLVFDQPSSTIVSAAMAPVVSAPTVEDAWILLGGADAMATEAAARSAADSAETNARIAADTAESNARNASDATLTNNLNAEIARATAAETALRPPGKIEWGFAGTDSSGHQRITFSSAYSATPAVVAQFQGTGYAVVSTTVNADTTGFDVWLALPAPAVTPTPGDFFWCAMGPP